MLVLITTVWVFSSKQKQSFCKNWYVIRIGHEFGISGMALLNHNNGTYSFLAVHDNKRKNEVRLAVVSINKKMNIQYYPLLWPDNVEQPVDLEAITALPETNNSQFLILASEGKVYHIKINADKSVSVIKIFYLPTLFKGDNFEGIALYKIGGRLLAVWAHRGDNIQPAIIYWGILNLNTREFYQMGSANFTAPWPKFNMRHIADLKIDPNGFLFVTSTSDSGDNGPFQSAVYVAGIFDIYNNEIIFRQNRNPVKIYQTNNHKIEGIELLTGGFNYMIFGSDDDNLGSSIYLW